MICLVGGGASRPPRHTPRSARAMATEGSRARADSVDRRRAGETQTATARSRNAAHRREARDDPLDTGNRATASVATAAGPPPADHQRRRAAPTTPLTSAGLAPTFYTYAPNARMAGHRASCCSTFAARTSARCAAARSPAASSRARCASARAASASECAAASSPRKRSASSR